MKIYKDSRYVDHTKQTEDWCELEVINMWDWKSRSVAWSYIGDKLISYSMTSIEITDDHKYKCTKVVKLTDEMKTILINMGYEVRD